MGVPHRWQLAAASVLSIVAGSGQAQAPSALERVAASPVAVNAREGAIADSLDALVPGWLARFKVPSIAIAHVRDGRIAWTRVYGEQAAGVPATERTLYNVASLTKPVFAEMILRLVAAGRISLDTPMAPVWVDPDVADDPRHLLLTPRLSLSHRTGFANWRRQTGGRLKFLNDPATKYGYSGEGFEYLKEYTRRVTGQSIDSAARALVFGPPGLRDIFVHREALVRGARGIAIWIQRHMGRQ